MVEPRSIGVIGFGVFGRFMVQEMARHAEVLVSARHATAEEVAAVGGRLVDFEVAAACGLAIPSVPVQHLEEVLIAMAPHLRPGSVVADVSSVKTIPVRLMERIVPEHCEILATHPLFGPQSGAHGIAGLPMVVWPVRIAEVRFAKIRTFLSETLGLDVQVVAPEEHDREMAYVHALTFFLGKALGEMGLPDTPIKTKTYQHLLDVQRIVAGDSDELFETIQHYNPYAAAIRKKFVDRLAAVDADLDEERATA